MKTEEVNHHIYTETQLISFGAYLLSKEREDRIATMFTAGGPYFDERKRDVYHSDIMNWTENELDKANKELV